jgi:hypothetical protein
MRGVKVIVISLLFLMLSACSTESEHNQQSGHSAPHQTHPSLNEQTDLQDINRSKNVIRSDTERSFRKITPDTPKSGNPHTSPPANESQPD